MYLTVHHPVLFPDFKRFIKPWRQSIHCTWFEEMGHSGQMFIKHRLWIVSDCVNTEYECVSRLSLKLRYPAIYTGLKPDLRNRTVCRQIFFVYDLLNIMFNFKSSTKTWLYVICVYLLRIKYLANLILLWIIYWLIDWCIFWEIGLSVAADGW